MRLPLIVHPQSVRPPVTSLEARFDRTDDGAVSVDFQLTGALGGLRLPAPASPRRADELWRHSCFELFVRLTGNSPYFEFNFAPSLAWAAYRFDGYRSGRQDIDLPPPAISVDRDDCSFRLSASIFGLPPGAWEIGMSTILEDAAGERSYWALAHPPGEPDFHHKDCFAVQVPPASQT